MDAVGRNAFGAQRRAGRCGRREMQFGHLRDQSPVQLFRKRLVIARPQPGLDMGQRQPRIGRRLGPRERAGGIALHDDRRRADRFEK